MDVQVHTYSPPPSLSYSFTILNLALPPSTSLPFLLSSPFASASLSKTYRSQIKRLASLIKLVICIKFFFFLSFLYISTSRSKQVFIPSPYPGYILIIYAHLFSSFPHPSQWGKGGRLVAAAAAWLSIVIQIHTPIIARQIKRYFNVQGNHIPSIEYLLT